MDRGPGSDHASRVAAILLDAGFSKAPGGPASVDGQPVEEDGFAVEVDGDGDVLVYWRSRFGPGYQRNQLSECRGFLERAGYTVQGPWSGVRLPQGDLTAGRRSTGGGGLQSPEPRPCLKVRAPHAGPADRAERGATGRP